MNTADIHLHRSAVVTLMVKDGFGPDEVRANLGSYSKELFGSDTPTGRLRVRAVINRLEAEAMDIAADRLEVVTGSYLLFAGQIYYPGGGWEDFAGEFSTLDAAVEAVPKLREPAAWWHVVHHNEIIKRSFDG